MKHPIEVRFGQRRIVRTNESLRITLPPAWYKSHGIGEGNFVDITMLEDGSLLLRLVKDKKTIESALVQENGTG